MWERDVIESDAPCSVEQTLSAIGGYRRDFLAVIKDFVGILAIII